MAEPFELLNLAYQNLEFDETGDNERKAHAAALEHFSRTSKAGGLHGKVWLLAAWDRIVSRYREDGRSLYAPDAKHWVDLAEKKAATVPVLELLRQNGDESKGWRGLPS